MYSREALLDHAEKARRSAHAPYSNFTVGSAIVDEDGVVHIGCNVENASAPEGVCAETVAVSAMVIARGKRIAAVAVVGALRDLPSGPCMPCGGCRQRIAEFSTLETEVITYGEKGEVVSRLLREVLPYAFRMPADV